MAIHGGDAAQLATQVRAIRAVDAAAIQRLAAGVIQPARMIGAVRGDKYAVGVALDALGVAKETIEWIASPKAAGKAVPKAETPKLAGLTD